MDNKINEIRSRISFLRSEMLTLEDAIRLQVNRDDDCSDTSMADGYEGTNGRPHWPAERPWRP
jgi:hypothetical protein